jgi:hypothetical protein
MNQRLKRLCSMAAGIAAIIPAMFLVQAVTGPGVANAACAGVGNEAVLSLFSGSQLLINERANPGTCNNNDLYGGSFRNETGNSQWRAVVWVQNGGVWTAHAGGYDTAAHSYSFTDNNSHSDIQLCLDNFDVGSTLICSPIFTSTGF